MERLLFKLKSKLVPLVFGITIVTSFMYNYDSNLTLIFLLCTIIMQGLLYIFYDYISTKSRIMQYISIIGSLIAMIFLIIAIGALYNPSNIVDFMVWFFSPQGVVEYSLQYIFVMLIGVNFFIASTIYYFTQVRYRMITTFLLFLLPFAIFTKEDSSMPIIFILLLIVLYFATLIVCGQNNLYKHNNVTMIGNKSYAKSVGTFVLTFMLISSAIPKPQIETNRDLFESLIHANSLTNFLLAQLGDFTDTSNGTGFSLLSSNRVLFTAETSETVAIKSRTFSSYNYDKNVWLRADGIKTTIENLNIDTTINHGDIKTNIVNYDRYGSLLSDDYTNDFQKSLNSTELLNAIVYACNNNLEFANKYNLSNIDLTHSFNADVRTVTIKDSYSDFNMILNPTNSYSFRFIASGEYYKSYVDFYLTDSGIYYGCLKTSPDSKVSVSNYSVEYYSNDIINDSNVLDILTKLNFQDYGNFLEDLSYIVKDSKYEDIVYSFIQDYQNTLTYCTVFPSINNDKISSLAEDITKGCTSDIEKALLLEDYFISNNYIYDAEYQQEENSTIEDFLFNSKTGACYEYSTSMILMARSLGLPARYVEGFLIDNPTGNSEPIKITVSSSHAYPEIYISGYGWCYFEPTQVLLSSLEEDNKIELSANYKLFLVSLSIVLITIIASIFVIYVYPNLYEKHFRKKVLNSSLEVALKLIVSRLLKIAKLSDSLTLEEIQNSIYTTYHVDITNIVELSNRVFYSSSILQGLSTDLIQSLLDTYILIYNSIIETNKEQKKSKKVNN